MNVWRRLCAVNPFAWPYFSFANFPALRHARATAVSNVITRDRGNRKSSSVRPSRIRDPIGYDGGINLYAYSRNNPTNLIEPEGLDVLVIEQGPTEGNPIGHT